MAALHSSVLSSGNQYKAYLVATSFQHDLDNPQCQVSHNLDSLRNVLTT